jgi:hypothetical protein
MNVWYNKLSLWLIPMGIWFSEDGDIWRISARLPNENPFEDGYYDFQSNDLKDVAVVGSISYNEHLIGVYEISKDK